MTLAEIRDMQREFSFATTMRYIQEVEHRNRLRHAEQAGVKVIKEDRRTGFKVMEGGAA